MNKRTILRLSAFSLIFSLLTPSLASADEMMQAGFSEVAKARMQTKESAEPETSSTQPGNEQSNQAEKQHTEQQTTAGSSNTTEHDESAADSNTPKPRIALETSMGKIVVELYPSKAPQTVANFIAYVDEGFYNGLIFHRVIRSFVIQSGGFDAAMNRRPTSRPNVPNESNNRLSNDRGTIAMARTANPDSANSQFYINVGMNLSLDYRFGKPGYTVFGKVIEGMDVAKKISRVPTRKVGGFADVPEKPVTLIKAYRDYSR